MISANIFDPQAHTSGNSCGHQIRTLLSELLSQSEIDSKKIERLLSLLGKQFGLSRAYIQEIHADRLTVVRTFSWCAPGLQVDVRRLQNRTPEQWEHYLSRFDKSGIFYCDSSNKCSEQKCFLEICKSTQTHATLQCAFYYDGALKAIAGFDECTQNRMWNPNEIAAMSEIARMLGTHLVHIRTQQTLKRIAFTDMLTGAYSFEAFRTEAQKLIQQHPEKSFALLSIDIDKFHDINDTYGHETGDRLLIWTASAIYSILNDQGIVCRVSADIFTILMQFGGCKQLEFQFDSLVRTFDRMGSAFGLDRTMFISCGIYLVERNVPITTMIDRASAARELVKRNGRHAFAYYDFALHRRLIAQKEMENSMHASLRQGHFIVFFQPKYNLDTMKMAGAEALVRWEHPVNGVISPRDFIPIFEKNSFVMELDYHVFEKVCALLQQWQNEGREIVPISVNFSRLHLSADKQFIERLLEIVQEYKISPRLLEIEFTESAFVDEHYDAAAITEQLKQHGFTVSMDDFGSGYSSLNLLKELPVDVLKLDKAFFNNGKSSPKEQIIIEGFVEIAHKLNMRVVCEGVETQEQADFLRRIQCDMAQGYLFAHPMPKENFEDMLGRQLLLV